MYLLSGVDVNGQPIKLMFPIGCDSGFNPALIQEVDELAPRELKVRPEYVGFLDQGDRSVRFTDSFKKRINYNDKTGSSTLDGTLMTSLTPCQIPITPIPFNQLRLMPSECPQPVPRMMPGGGIQYLGNNNEESGVFDKETLAKLEKFGLFQHCKRPKDSGLFVGQSSDSAAASEPPPSYFKFTWG